MRVKISNHAHARWRQYCYDMRRTQLSALVERHLFEALRGGVEIKNDALHIGINSRVNAVVEPDFRGRWVVKTFYLKDKVKNVEVLM